MFDSVEDLRRRHEDGVFVRWLFLRGLAVISFVAFLSFHLQFPGLIGSEGILPLADFLQSAETAGASFFDLPTLSWFFPSETGVKFLTVGGMVLSAFLFLGVAPVPVLFLLWLFYLSVVNDGQIFMSYQWDLLLLETLFVSIFVAPRNLLPRTEVTAPSWLSFRLLHVVLFKLIFLSGVGKILAGPTWRDLTAMTYHYWTQPLPTPVAWYVAKLPPSFHKLSTLLVLVIEVVVPFLIFAPRRYRVRGAYVLILFQVTIVATGNYAFFNILAILLCLLLFDDEHLASLRGRLPGHVLPELNDDETNSASAEKAVVALVTVVLVLNAFVLVGFFLPSGTVPPVDATLEATSGFKTVNSYGLFVRMTTSRPELVVQGSEDGETWRTYRFRYKPDDLGEPPPVVAPHQPRLDWQMWFAALSSPRRSRWVVRLSRRLLEGSEDVEALLAHDPFGDENPEFVRVLRYRYEFTDAEERKRTGRWWKRSGRELYLRPVSLETTR